MKFYNMQAQKRILIALKFVGVKFYLSEKSMFFYTKGIRKRRSSHRQSARAARQATI